MKSRSTSSWKIIQLPEDQCVGSTRILQPDECWSPTTGSNAGKHKAGDNVHTYDQLPFLEDSGGPGGSVTSDDVSNESNVSGSTVTDALNALFNISTPAGLPYLYTSATSGDPGDGAIGFNDTTAASINSVRIKFGDDDGTDHSGLVTQLTATGGTMLFRWDGGSLVLRVGANVGSFGSWAQFDATYVSGGLPTTDGTAMSVDVGLYPSRPKYYRAELEVGAPDPIVVAGSETNELGGTAVWTGDGSGTWILTLTGAFPANKTKTWAMQSDRNGTSVVMHAYRDGSNDTCKFEFLDVSLATAEPTGNVTVWVEVTP